MQDLERVQKYAQNLSIDKERSRKELNKPIRVKFSSAPVPKVAAAESSTGKGLLWESGTTLRFLFINSLKDPSLEEAGLRGWLNNVRDKIRAIAPYWAMFANLKFEFEGIEDSAAPRAHVTINLLPNGEGGLSWGTYSSQIGRQNLAALEKGSMNLLFDPANPNNTEDEFRRVLLHEFGHILGFIHEFSRPDRPIVWNEPVIYEYFHKIAGWAPQQVQEAILAPFEARAGWIIPNEYRDFDVNSIMMFPFPPGLATYKNGTVFVSGWNGQLSQSDKIVANIIYPAKVPALEEVVLTPGDPPRAGSIKIAGQVARYRFRPSGGSIHSIETGGQTPLLLALRYSGNESRSASEGTGAKLLFRPLHPGDDYLVEVRHAYPMSGTGDFTIKVVAGPHSLDGGTPSDSNAQDQVPAK